MIHYSSLLLGTGVLAGLWLIASKTPIESRSNQLNAGLISLIGALAGSRLVETLMHWPYYRNHLAEIILINHGGLAPSGAAAGMLLTLWVWSRYTKSSYWSAVDMIIPLALALTIAGWLSCWIDGCAYGSASTASWALPAPDETGWISPRIPIQLIAALFAFFWFQILARPLAQQLKPGQTAGLFLAGISAFHFALTYIRADPIPIWFGMRWDAWSSLASTAAGLSIYRMAGAQST